MWMQASPIQLLKKIQRMENISNSTAPTDSSERYTAIGQTGFVSGTSDNDKEMFITDDTEIGLVEDVDVESDFTRREKLLDNRKNEETSATTLQEKESHSALKSPEQFVQVQSTATQLRTVESNADNHGELREFIHQTDSEEKDDDLSGIAPLMDFPEERDHGSHSTSACSMASSTGDITPPAASGGQKRRKAYPRDLSAADFATPTRREKNFKFLKDCLSDTRHKLEMNHQRTRRVLTKVENFVTLLNDLQERSMFTLETSKMIEMRIKRLLPDVVPSNRQCSQKT